MLVNQSKHFFFCHRTAYKNAHENDELHLKDYVTVDIFVSSCHNIGRAYSVTQRKLPTGNESYFKAENEWNLERIGNKKKTHKR